MAGLFITFEGGEGCGKSTQIKRLSAQLQAAQREVLTLREPGGTPLGEAIRHLLKHDPVGQGMCPEAELLLFTASRAQLTRETILPAIEANTIVLCDRFMDSTTVYQGVARKLPPERVATINQFAVGDARPDLTFLIDLPPEIGMERVKVRTSNQLDRMEQEAIDFFHQVRDGYQTLAQTEPDRFVILDGSQSIESLETQIWNAVKPRLT